MTFEEYIQESKTKLSIHLESYFTKKESEDLPDLFKKQKLLETLKSFSVRGKMIRGSLFLLIVEGFGVKIQKKHYDIACAIELAHSSLLIQDDIIDKDKTRRGFDTAYYHYEKEGKSLKAYEPYHYGISTAMMVSDVAFFLSMDLVTSLDEVVLPKLLKYFANEIRLVAVAESVDSIFGQTPIEPGEKDIYDVYLHKTARYTFSMPFVMAAIIAGKDKNTINSLKKLGEAAGIIFQLKDDEIGLFGDEQKIGKPVGSDIRENKKTIIRYLLFSNTSIEDRNTLIACFGNDKIQNHDINLVRQLYRKYGIGVKIESKIKSLSDLIEKELENVKLKTVQKGVLQSLLEYNLKRTY